MRARPKSYGQFCPVAQAAEIVAERWTPLVLRELLCGSRRFSDLRRGVPLMSPALLSQRLKELEYAGVVVRRPAAARRTASGGRERARTGWEYELTLPGQELRPVIEMLGLWGQRWLRRELRKDELDPALLMWDVRRNVEPAAFPADRRTVVEFEIAGVPAAKRMWWLVFDDGEVDLCLKDPGHEVDVRVAATIRDLVQIWMGRVAMREAVRTGAIRLEGSGAMVRAFKDSFRLSVFARATTAARVADTGSARRAARASTTA